MKYKKFFKNKKIIVTGHTGFKGSWLALWLHTLGAKVMGISNDIPTKPSHYQLIKLNKKIISKNIDVYNLHQLKKTINKFKPDFIFHLAAQSIVKKSYLNPIETWKTNLFGTINILESLKNQKKETIVIIITSDKAYKNIETKRGYKEDDAIGAEDPYGASKSAAEIAKQSYVKNFFSSKKNKIFISVARAGNVIGGGDWSSNRLIPDCMKSWLKRKKVVIRNPNSTRPWQHVIEVIYGYLTLAVKLKKNKKLHGEAFNFGPDKNKVYKVNDILKEMKKKWPIINWKISKKKNFKENVLLHLNSRKAKEKLNWNCVLNFKKTINLTIDWYKFYLKNKNKVMKKSIEQIYYYQSMLNRGNNR